MRNVFAQVTAMKDSRQETHRSMPKASQNGTGGVAALNRRYQL